MKHNKLSLIRQIDCIITKTFRIISYAAGVIAFVVVVLATANVICSKLTHVSIPSANDWITYLLVPIVYLSIGYMVLDRGLIEVDFVSKHYPRWLKIVISLFSTLACTIINVFIIRYQLQLTNNYLALNKMSSTSPLHFPLWPFPVIILIGMVMMSVAMLWKCIRSIVATDDMENT